MSYVEPRTFYYNVHFFKGLCLDVIWVFAKLCLERVAVHRSFFWTFLLVDGSGKIISCFLSIIQWKFGYSEDRMLTGLKLVRRAAGAAAPSILCHAWEIKLSAFVLTLHASNLFRTRGARNHQGPDRGSPTTFDTNSNEFGGC